MNSTFTLRGAKQELIGDGRSLLAWLVDAALLEERDAARLKRRLGADALDEAAREARELRSWATAWIGRWSERPGDAYETEARKLNAWMERARDYRELERVGDRFQLTMRRRDESADEILAMLAASIASLVADEDPSLVKRCQGSECTLMFVDRTKAHRRRFCSVAACGNREKVAAFRKRQRSGQS